MDATHDVGVNSTMLSPTGYPQTAEDLRRDIRDTSQALHGHMAQLEGYVHDSFGSFDNPFHLRERIARRPFVACGLAIAAGFLFGVTRTARRAVPEMAGQGMRHTFGLLFNGLGRTLGTEVAATLLRKL
jgi:hypothetical protein